MSISTSKTKAEALAHVLALIAGTQKHFPNGSLTFGNITYTTASLVALLQGVSDAMTALNVAELAAKHALAASQGVQAQVNPVIQIYERFLQATFANTVPTLADFDLAPHKVPAPRTVEQKAATAAKARATRVARGTTSKKQKLTVTGNVTGITITPVTAPTPAQPSAQPAPAASSVPNPGTATK